MKKIITILILFSLKVSATNYYISNSGNDSNNGLTISTSWLTINKVSASYASFGGGDSVLFKRGDTFYGVLQT